MVKVAGPASRALGPSGYEATSPPLHSCWKHVAKEFQENYVLFIQIASD